MPSVIAIKNPSSLWERTWVRTAVTLLFLLLSIAVKAQTRFDYFYIEAEKCKLADDYSSAMELYQHCLDINPDAPEALYNLGLIQIYLRQDSLGTAMLQRACQQDSANAWYLESLASLYLNRHNTTAAIPVLEKLAKLKSKRSDILVQLAHIYQAVDDKQKAIEALNRIELLEGKSAQLILEKYSLYRCMGEEDLAFAELQSLCQEFPHDMGYKVLAATQYEKAGRQADAEALYDEVRRKDPSNANLLMAMLEHYKNQGQIARFEEMRDSILYHPDTPNELRVPLMRSYIAEAQADSSLSPVIEKAFEKILALPQSDTQMLTLRAAYLLYRKEDGAKMVQVMKEILQIEPGNEMAMSKLLQYYAPKNDYAAIEDICRRGVNYHPEELAYHYYLGISLYQQDKNAEACDAFVQGLRTRTEEADDQLVSDMFTVLGDLYYQQQRPEEAFAVYDSALVYVDDNVGCLNNYAYYLCLRGEQLDKAEQMSYRTIKAEPNNITYLDTYAWILFVKKDYTNARLYIDRVVNPEWSDEEILQNQQVQGNLVEHAGDIYIQCGQTDIALRLWKLAVKKKDGTCTPQIAKKIKQKKYIR